MYASERLFFFSLYLDNKILIRSQQSKNLWAKVNLVIKVLTYRITAVLKRRNTAVIIKEIIYFICIIRYDLCMLIHFIRDLDWLMRNFHSTSKSCLGPQARTKSAPLMFFPYHELNKFACLLSLTWLLKE